MNPHAERFGFGFAESTATLSWPLRYSSTIQPMPIADAADHFCRARRDWSECRRRENVSGPPVPRSDSAMSVLMQQEDRAVDRVDDHADQQQRDRLEPPAPRGEREDDRTPRAIAPTNANACWLMRSEHGCRPALIAARIARDMPPASPRCSRPADTDRPAGFEGSPDRPRPPRPAPRRPAMRAARSHGEDECISYARPDEIAGRSNAHAQQRRSTAQPERHKTNVSNQPPAAAPPSSWRLPVESRREVAEADADILRIVRPSRSTCRPAAKRTNYRSCKPAPPPPRESAAAAQFAAA